MTSVDNNSNLKVARSVHHGRRLHCSAAIAALSIAATGAVAQDNDRAGIDQIVVTAQKKEEYLQKTPVAVGVLDGEYLDAARVIDFEEITQRIPGFAFQQENRTQTAVALRGAGSLEDSPGADPAVGFFVDGVYMGNPATFDFDLLDLQRVEVLRGPQGTTFGRNVVGGAINFVTRNPTDELSGRASLTYGRFGLFDINGNVSGPLIEGKLSALASFNTTSSDGYTKNLTTGTTLDQIDQTAGRVKFRWTPTDNFEALLSADYARDKSVGISRVFTGPSVPTEGAISTNNNEVNQDLDGGYDGTAWGVNGILKYALGESGEIVSVTSYRENDLNTSFEIDGTPAVVISFTDADTNIEEFSQELRVVNSWSNFDIIAGLYYFNQKISRIETIDEGGTAGSFIDTLFFDGTGTIKITEVLGQNVETNSYAAFAQGTYHISDRIRAHVGGRYTWEKKSGNTLCVQPGLQCGAVYDVPIEEDWGAFTPKFILDADLTEDIFAYATVSRGFKSGGFASGFEEAESAAVPFDPEFAWNYEIGVKSLWFDDRLQMNLTGFYVEYTDLQVRFFSGGEDTGRVIVGNAGSADNIGLELEMLAKPLPNLNLWANYTFQDAEYDSLILEGEDFSGNTILLTPRHSLSMGGDYTVTLANDSSITLMADFAHKGEYFADPANDPGAASRLKGIVNASISYTFPNENWQIQFSAKNLRNERSTLTRGDIGLFTLDINDFLAGGQGYRASLTAPRTWAVSLKYNY